MSEELQPVFSIERLFVKDLSLEVPNAPQIFLEQGEPEVDMRVSTNSEKLEDGYYNVDVTVTVTAKLNAERTMFLNEVTRRDAAFHVIGQLFPVTDSVTSANHVPGLGPVVLHILFNHLPCHGTGVGAPFRDRAIQ